jgi:MFS family permease
MKGLWKNPDFMKLWTGQSISVFGSMVGGTAMTFVAILVLKATPFQMGLLNTLELLPAFLIGLAAGAWVDRLHRRPFLIAADFGRALVLATIPAAALFGRLTILQVYGVTVIVSILTIFFDVAYQSFLPVLVSKNELVEGNSKLSASAAVAEVGGFGLGGWLVQLLTAPFAILIDAGSFIISAVLVGQILTREAEIVPEETPNLRSEIVAGLREVWQQPILRACALVILIHVLSNSLYGALVVLYMSRGLGFQPGILGMTWAVGGVSSFLGAMFAPRVAGRLGLGRAMTIGLLCYGIAGLFVPLAVGANWVSVVLLVLAQLGDGFYIVYEINLVSLRQTITPGRLLGRVNGTMQFIVMGAGLVGSLLGGWMGEVVGVRLVLLIGAAGTLLGAAYLALSPVRLIKS